ncbi:MAG: class F sortase [Dehalococcoidia bacterium]
MKLGLLALPAVGGALALAGLLFASAAPEPDLKYHVVAPALSRADVVPTPTLPPRPVPYNGPVASLYLASAHISAQWPVAVRDTVVVGGRETFENPAHPDEIAWYARFGQPGFAANNSIFAAHINYVNYGNGPFAYLTSAAIDDALYVTMDNGTSYAYTVKTVEVVSLAELEAGAMDRYVFPVLDSYTERITLISCGGDFVPRAGGGGDYTSRVILVAERYVN